MSLTPDAMPDTWTSSRFRGIASRTLLSQPRPASDANGARHSTPSDFDLNPGALAEFGPARAPRPAAVLVPIVARSELTVLLTRRTDHLPAHAGQISFPGGKIDEADDGSISAALREAEEEIGLDRAAVEPLGFLDPYCTGTGYVITPVVALVEPGFTLTLNRGEVADAFEVPLAFLMQERNFRIDTKNIAGRERRFYAVPYGEHYIWGATAGILKNMHERLFQP